MYLNSDPCGPGKEEQISVVLESKKGDELGTKLNY